MKAPLYGVIEDDNVIYSPERYGGEMLLGVSRHKGSTGVVKLTWGVTIETNASASFIISPMAGVLEFNESQWNSSIHLQFPPIHDPHQQIDIFVKLLNVSGGAMLGNFTTVKITLPWNVSDSEENNSTKTDVSLKILLPCLTGALLIIGIIILMCKSRRR